MVNSSEVVQVCEHMKAKHKNALFLFSFSQIFGSKIVQKILAADRTRTYFAKISKKVNFAIVCTYTSLNDKITVYVFITKKIHCNEFTGSLGMFLLWA